MKRKLCALAAIVLLVSMLSGTAVAENGVRSLTLEEAINLAMVNNDQVELNRLSVDKAKLKLEQDKYAAKKLDEDFVTSFDAAYLKYILPVISQMNLTLAEAKARLSDDALKLEVEKAYYELLKKQADLQNATNALDRAKEQLRIAQASFKAGVLAKSEVIGAEVLVASKEAALLTAQNEYDKANMSLAKSLGLPLDTEIEPAGTFSFEPVKIDLAKEIEKGLQNDVEVIGAREGLKVAEATLEQAKRFYTPNVFMYREAEYGLEEAKVTLRQKEKAVELKIRQAYLDLQSAEKAYQTLEKSLASARETYRVAKLKFEAGVATRLEMEKAADSLSEQEAGVQEMLYNYNLAAAQFRYGLFLGGSTAAAGMSTGAMAAPAGAAGSTASFGGGM